MVKSFAVLILAVMGGAFTAVAQFDKILPLLKEESLADDIEINADKFEMDQKSGWVTARGHVVGKAGENSFRADQVKIHRENGDVKASGNVEIKKGALGSWKGDYIEFNYKTGKGLTGMGQVDAGAFHIQSDEVTRREDGRFDAKGMAVTTCTNAPGKWHWCVRGDGRFKDNDYVELFHAVPYLFGIPFAYLPWAYRDLDTHYGLRMMPGYTSRWGAYLKNAYVYNLYRTPGGYSFSGSTHADYRTRRGLGVGQNFDWDWQQWGRGRFEAYYADDQNPRSSWKNHNWISDFVDDRYRFRLFHKADLTPRDQFILRGTYLSDSEMRHDFFEHEDRGESIPMNFASYEHREHFGALGVNISGPLNDFYSGTSHLPEGWLTIVPQPLFLGLNYEGELRAGYLERDYGYYKEADDPYRYFPGHYARYDTSRLETSHRLTYPLKMWDTISLVPRAGYRGTYYSDNAQYDDIYRQSADLGAELSLRGTSDWSSDWRHVFEPYLDYSFQPTDSNISRDSSVYLFDRFDRSLGWFDQFGLDGTWLPYDWHGVRPGVRNLLQTHGENGRMRTLVDWDTYAGVQFDSEGAKSEEGIRMVGSKVIVAPAEELDLKAQGEWDTEVETMAYVDLSALYEMTENFKVGGGYIARDHDLYDYGVSPIRQWNEVHQNLIYGGFTHAINDQWSYSPYIRYDLRENELDEVGATIEFQLDCLVFQVKTCYVNAYERIDGTKRGDDFRLSFTMFLRALKKEHREEWRAW